MEKEEVNLMPNIQNNIKDNNFKLIKDFNYNYNNELNPGDNNQIIVGLNREIENNNMYSLNNPNQNLINTNLINNEQMGYDINNMLTYNNFNNYNNNPQHFQPHFHPSISFKYISNLQIQYPVQMFVKKSKASKITRHKLITYYPQKVQIEIRPCFIYQQNYLFNQKIQIPYKNYQFPIYSNKLVERPQVQNELYFNDYINNNINNEFNNKKRIVHNKVKRRRPVYKIPPCKKASVSQGKSLSFIHKYYDENFILEEDDEEEKINKDKIILSERKKKKEKDNKIESNYFSDNEEKRIKKKIDLVPKDNKININIINMKNDNKGKEYRI